MNAQRLTMVGLAIVCALATLALTAAQAIYWGDAFAAFATFCGGAFITAFLMPD